MRSMAGARVCSCTYGYSFRFSGSNPTATLIPPTRGKMLSKEMRPSVSSSKFVDQAKPLCCLPARRWSREPEGRSARPLVIVSRLPSLAASADGTVVVTTSISEFLPDIISENRLTSHTVAAARRARQASRADAPRVAKRVFRAQDEEPSSRHTETRDSCHGGAARTRCEELSMACCRHANEEMLSGMDGRMAQGGRLPAIALVRATYRRCRR